MFSVGFTGVSSRLSVCFPSGVLDRSLASVVSVVRAGPSVEVRLCSSDHHVNCWDADTSFRLASYQLLINNVNLPP